MENIKKSEQASYFSVLNWMGPKLKLSGNDLLVFAYIYSLTVHTASKSYYGGIENLMELFNMSRSTAIRTLARLCDKDLIIKSEEVGRGCVKYFIYKANLNLINTLKV